MHTYFLHASYPCHSLLALPHFCVPAHDLLKGHSSTGCFESLRKERRREKRRGEERRGEERRGKRGEERRGEERRGEERDERRGRGEERREMRREKKEKQRRGKEEEEEGEERNIQSGRVTSRRELFFMARTTRETSVVRDFTLLKLVITSTLTSDKQEVTKD